MEKIHRPQKGPMDEVEKKFWEFVKNYSEEECIKVISDHRNLKSLTVTILREVFSKCETVEDMLEVPLNEVYLKNPLKKGTVYEGNK